MNGMVLVKLKLYTKTWIRNDVSARPCASFHVRFYHLQADIPLLTYQKDIAMLTDLGNIYPLTIQTPGKHF